MNKCFVTLELMYRLHQHILHSFAVRPQYKLFARSCLIYKYLPNCLHKPRHGIFCVRTSQCLCFICRFVKMLRLVARYTAHPDLLFWIPSLKTMTIIMVYIVWAVVLHIIFVCLIFKTVFLALPDSSGSTLIRHNFFI